ncbi:hypothetical protein [Paenibacillus mendelii]|uniref:hypothetical protein n=1 Tax=Paenibacillus mendelii TaxID=206163 RepID=UPI00195E7E9B|nr:hypothetical protein [Paenibacillus mendelii]MCQ6563158.1 hypothetical protein [Paenibacillus mendelii]
MRHELIHFLSHVKEEKTMIEVIVSLNADAYDSLLHYLAYTSMDTQEHWREILNKLLH